MRRLLSLGCTKWLSALVLTGSLGAAAWMGWTPFWSWYYLRGLVAADDQEQQIWVKRIACLDVAALPGLLDCLKRDDPRVCANAEAALAYLARAWGLDEPRSQELADRLRDEFAAWSVPGQEAVLEWQLALLGSASVPEPFLQASRDLLVRAAARTEKGVRLRTLALADVLLEQPGTGPWLVCCRDLIGKGLTDADPEARVRAVHLTLHSRFRQEFGLLQQVLPLLRDNDARVRRAALLAVAPVKEVVSEDELLPLLHDPSDDVRRLCETALRSRGLQDGHILIGRLISDSRASARLEVVEYLQQPGDLDRGVWLRRLSQDPAPAVRAAAVRAAASQSQVDLGDCLRQMAAGDPNPTVRQLAAYYLRRR